MFEEQGPLSGDLDLRLARMCALSVGIQLSRPNGQSERQLEDALHGVNHGLTLICRSQNDAQLAALAEQTWQELQTLQAAVMQRLRLQFPNRTEPGHPGTTPA